MTKYPTVSVMTPVHNISEDDFTRAYKSLKIQTYDFSKIEWIVVIHDMDEKYIKKIRSIATEGNVRIISVNGKGSSLSVPRNIALDHANGKYLFFLDADDEFSPDCIRETVSVMEETGAEITRFQIKYVIDNPAEKEKLNADLYMYQSFEEKRKKRLEKLRGTKKIFNMTDDIRIFADEAGGYKALPSICCNADFLKKCGVRFDETLHGGGDFLFTIETGKYLNNFCILTEFYGYVYHLRKTSMSYTTVIRTKEILECPKILEALKESEKKQNWNLNTSKWSLFIARTFGAAFYVNDKTVKETVNCLREYIFNFRAFVCESSSAPIVLLMRHQLNKICNILTEKQKKIISSSYLHRISHKNVLFNFVPVKDDFREYLRNTAKDVPELRVMQWEGETNPFLAFESETLYPVLHITDLSKTDKNRQDIIIENCNKAEILRGFNPQKEIPLRITLFQISSSESVLSVTWNDFFISPCTIERLIQDIKVKSGGKYNAEQ